MYRASRVRLAGSWRYTRLSEFHSQKDAEGALSQAKAAVGYGIGIVGI